MMKIDIATVHAPCYDEAADTLRLSCDKLQMGSKNVINKSK